MRDQFGSGAIEVPRSAMSHDESFRRLRSPRPTRDATLGHRNHNRTDVVFDFKRIGAAGFLHHLLGAWNEGGE
jgi:hypothetical protein